MWARFHKSQNKFKGKVVSDFIDLLLCYLIVQPHNKKIWNAIILAQLSPFKNRLFLKLTVSVIVWSAQLVKVKKQEQNIEVEMVRRIKNYKWLMYEKFGHGCPDHKYQQFYKSHVPQLPEIKAQSVSTDIG